MEIKSNLNGEELTVELSGELNAMTAPQLSTFLAPHLEKINPLFLTLRNVILFRRQGSACCSLRLRR
jgi:hypothetical protein